MHIQDFPQIGIKRPRRSPLYENDIVSEISDNKEINEVNFSNNLKLISKHQRTEPSRMAKYDIST